MKILTDFINRLRAIIDPSVLILIVPALVVGLFLDPPMFITLAEWSVFYPVIVGISLLIAQILFFQIRFGHLVKKVMEENSLPAAIVLFGLIMFTAISSIAITLWVRV
ncbi:holin [Morganella phage Mecenats66]|nr:holin [Morganella phage Mecenats66]